MSHGMLAEGCTKKEYAFLDVGWEVKPVFSIPPMTPPSWLIKEIQLSDYQTIRLPATETKQVTRTTLIEHCQIPRFPIDPGAQGVKK